MILRRIRGNSMLPSLANGDIVLACGKTYRPGDIIVFKTPKGESVKRIKKITKTGVYVLGDNTHDSFDSLAYGVVKKSAIVGVVMIKIRLATSPPKLAQPQLFWAPIAAGVLTASLVLLQLGSFEKFALAINNYGIFTGQGAVVFALVIAALELLAIPALFRLRLSPAMRYLSTGAIVAAPFLWLVLLSYAFVSGFTLANTGLFGGIIELPTSLYLLLISLFILGMAILSLLALGPTHSPAKKLPHRT